MNNEYPAWYQSSNGPQISATVKGIVMLLLPALKQAFGIEFDNQVLDGVVDAVLIVGFGAWTLWGYIRAKRVLGAKIDRLQGQLAGRDC